MSEQFTDRDLRNHPKTVSIPIWMIEYLEETALRNNKTVSIVVAELVKKDYEEKQKPK